MMERFALLNPDMPAWLLPSQPYQGDAGWDLRAWLPNGPVLLPLSGHVTVPTGLRVYLQPGEFGSVRERSSRPGIVVHGGVIDSGYEGEILVNLTRVSTRAVNRVEPGDKIAQLVIQPYVVTQVVKSTPKRGKKGFGSSGK